MARDGGSVGGRVELEVLRVVGLLLLLLLGVVLGHLAATCWGVEETWGARWVGDSLCAMLIRMGSCKMGCLLELCTFWSEMCSETTNS